MGLGHVGQSNYRHGLEEVWGHGMGLEAADLSLSWHPKCLGKSRLRSTAAGGAALLPEQADVVEFHPGAHQQFSLAGLMVAGQGDLWGTGHGPHH